MAFHPLDDKRLALGPWQAFERSLARFLEHHGFQDVKVVGGSGDGGADIVGNYNGKRWVVQAKFRSSSNVQEEALHETWKAYWLYKANVAVATTNSTFSDSAKKFCEIKQKQGYDIFLWDKNYLIDQSLKLSLEHHARRELRKYQNDAIDKIWDAYSSDKGKGLVTLATGLGKTMIASTFMDQVFKSNENIKILVLAHMNDLVKQLEMSSWCQLTKNIHTHIWADAEKPRYFEGITFATWQSLLSAIKNGEILKNIFDILIVDEAHHAASPSFKNVINEINPKFLFGLTATPWRGDGQSLVPLFGNPIFSMSIVEGMQKGFLAEVDYLMLVDGIDWEKISDLSKQGLTVKDLNTRLLVPERDMGIVEQVLSTIKNINRSRTLIFCRSIMHAERLAKFFLRYDTKVGVLHSNMTRSERFLILSDFRNGNISILLTIEILNEGIDIPEVNVVVFARVTHSRRIFLQQLGRGLRLSGNKEKVVVLDFVADIRRLSAAKEINNEAKKFTGEIEEIKYPDGEIVKFSSNSGSFFYEYLEDISDISDLDEDSKLQFPPA